MAIELAKIKIVTNAMQKEEDFVYQGWIHPQINDRAMINVILENYDMTGHAEYSVLVEGESISGPYTFDVNPTRDFEVGETLDAIDEIQEALADVLSDTDDPFEGMPRVGTSTPEEDEILDIMDKVEKDVDTLGQDDNDGFC